MREKGEPSERAFPESTSGRKENRTDVHWELSVPRQALCGRYAPFAMYCKSLGKNEMAIERYRRGNNTITATFRVTMLTGTKKCRTKVCISAYKKQRAISTLDWP